MKNDQNSLILLESLSSRIAKITLNNPPLNLNSMEMTRQLECAITRIAEDESVRVAILTGEGDKAFCAGSDIKEFSAISDDFVGKKLRKENEVFDSVENLGIPVIAAIEGVALGGGCELAMACDIRIMSETARIGLPEINLGVFGGSGGLFRTPKLIGLSRAMELMYLGDAISAHEAEKIGLINHVAPAGESLGTAISLAERIAQKPIAGLKAIKKGIRECLRMPHKEALELNFALTDLVFKTDDCQEAVSAFLEKRKAVFK